MHSAYARAMARTSLVCYICETRLMFYDVVKVIIFVKRMTFNTHGITLHTTFITKTIIFKTLFIIPVFFLNICIFLTCACSNGLDTSFKYHLFFE